MGFGGGFRFARYGRVAQLVDVNELRTENDQFRAVAETYNSRPLERPLANTVAGMVRILITGMSGTGKSTILAELSARGWRTVDTDYDGWTDGNGGPWDEPRMAELLAHNSKVVVSGTSENQVHFYDRFEHVVLLSAPVDVLIDRVRRRTNNPYGQSAEQQRQIRSDVTEVEPLLRRGATVELDARLSVESLVDAIESL